MARKIALLFGTPRTDLVYAYEAIRIKFSSKRRIVDTLQELYESYIDKVRGKEICPRGGYQNYRMFISFRERSLGKLTADQEAFLIKLLKSEVGRWFVPYVLNVIDIFSVELLNKLIDTAIEVEDPEHISFFLNPAIRVFDLKVNLDLQDRFREASMRNKEKVLRTFDRVGSRKVNRVGLDGFNESYGAKYAWSGTKFRNNVRMKETDYTEYCQSVRLIYDYKLEVLLAEYLRSTTKGIRDAISQYLPKEISEFPPNLQKQANAYIKLLKSRAQS